jgi:adenine-specific DNA-methyltransferase
MKPTLQTERDECFPNDRPTEGSPWRPIHYLGSKLRALSSIQDALTSVSAEGSKVYDIFAGSGTVSLSLAKSRPVVAVDIQEYSRVICSALLSPNMVDIAKVGGAIEESLHRSKQSGACFVAKPLIDLEDEAIQLASKGQTTLLADLMDAGSLVTSVDMPTNRQVRAALSEAKSRVAKLGPQGLISAMILRHFGGLYFSFKQAAELDAIISMCHAETDQMRDTILAAALSSASEIVNSVGKQFAQPIRPRDKRGEIKSSLYALVSRDRFRSASETFISSLAKYSMLSRSRFDCNAVRSDYFDFLSGANLEGGVVYADPPYTRDHYSRFYHVLETMSLRDDPAVSTNKVRGRTNPSRGAYREGRHQSPFCVRSQAPEAFDRMFAASARHGVPIVLSYSPYAADKDAHPRVMTIDAINEIARRHYRIVDVVSVGAFSHSKLNRTGLNKEMEKEAEFLIVCQGAL